MIVKNTFKKTIISKDLLVLDNFLDLSLGLIKFQDKDLYFHTRFGIHTFFLKRPIDVLILDDSLKIVKIKKSLKPFRFFFWNPIYSKVIEFSNKNLIKSKTEKGDRVKFLNGTGR